MCPKSKFHNFFKQKWHKILSDVQHAHLLAANRQSNLYLIFHFINLLGSNRIQVKSVKIKEELQQTKAPLMRSCRGCLGDVPAKAGPLFFFEPLWFGSNYGVASWPCHTGAYPAPPALSFCHRHHHHHHRTIFSPSCSPHSFLFIIGLFLPHRQSFLLLHPLPPFFKIDGFCFCRCTVCVCQSFAFIVSLVAW